MSYFYCQFSYTGYTNNNTVKMYQGDECKCWHNTWRFIGWWSTWGLYLGIHVDSLGNNFSGTHIFEQGNIIYHNTRWPVNVRDMSVNSDLTYRSAFRISWYSEYLSLRTTISTGSTGGGTLIRPSLDLATGSVRDFLPRTASTSTALLGARSRAAWMLLPPITWNISASKCGYRCSWSLGITLSQIIWKLTLRQKC